MNLETLKQWTRWICNWIVFVIVATWAVSQLPTGRDSTDEQGWFSERSGMQPMTDKLTGCQYLKVSGGGITPRLNEQGKQVGCGDV